MINEKAIQAANFMWSTNIYLLIMSYTLLLSLVTRSETPRYSQHCEEIPNRTLYLHQIIYQHKSLVMAAWLWHTQQSLCTRLSAFRIMISQDPLPFSYHCVHALWPVPMNQDETTRLLGQLPHYANYCQLGKTLFSTKWGGLLSRCSPSVFQRILCLQVFLFIINKLSFSPLTSSLHLFY